MQDISRIYQDFHRQLIAYAISFLPKEEAEDVVHDVFSHIISDNVTFPGRKEARNFLYLSVRNKCLDIIKHKAVVRNFVSESSHTMDRDTQDEIFAGEIYARLFKHIDTLPRRQRDTLLHYCEGKSNAEIALSMNVSLDTVKNQKYKAIATLKNVLGKSLTVLFIMLYAKLFKLLTVLPHTF